MRRNRPAGFTLIEVLLAVGILVTVAAILFRSMAMSYEIKARVTAVNDRYHEGRQVMERITREIRMAFLHAMPVQGETVEDPAFLTVFKGEEEELNFASTAHLRMQAGERESDQAEFGYFLKTGDNTGPYRGKTLYRRESRRIDSKPDRGGATWPMVEGVKELKFEYWDDKKEIAEDAWKRSWDSSGDDKDFLPARVRITLVLDMGEDRPEIRFVSQAAPKIRKPISAEDALKDAKQKAIEASVGEAIDKLQKDGTLGGANGASGGDGTSGTDSGGGINQLGGRLGGLGRGTSK